MSSYQSLEDEALVPLIQNKDQELYIHLVKRYQQRLIRYARYLGASDDQAEDIVQESFIKSFINLNSFKTDKKFSSWIYRIVHNHTINFLKKEQKSQHTTLSDWLSEIIPSKANLEEEFELELSKEELRRQLDKLAHNHKEVLILYYFEDKRYQEISEILRIPTSTVGIRLRRAKQKLRELCQKKP